MKIFFVILSILLSMPVAQAAGENITYKVNDKSYEGYFVSPSSEAPLVLLIHDWNGLTDYEIQRSEMLAKEGYAVMAADLFGAGVRPTED
jgi:dienelactone hydrolase